MDIATKFKIKIVEIEQNRHLKERRYYDLNKKIVKIVFFDFSNSKLIRGDSLCFVYDSNGILNNVIEYSFIKNKYQKIKSSLSYTFYKNLFDFKNSCQDIFSYNESYLIPNELSDICQIRKSVLADGRYVQSLEKIYKKGNLSVIEYDKINSRFNNLSDDLKTFFYGQELISFKITINNNHLIKEEYVFEGGLLQRIYIYQNEKMKNIDIVVSRKNGTLQTISRYFKYKF